MQQLLLKGTITLDDTYLNRMSYVLTNCQGKKTSLTSILDTIYNSKNCIKKLVRVAGKICDNGHQFNCFEGLHIKKDKRGILGYHCGSFAIEKQLYELAEYGKEVELIIQDYTGSISDFITHTTEDNVYDTATKTA